MRTIQVRDIPDDAYDTIRRRARAEGKSLQSYMRDQVIALARDPSKREAVEAIEEALAAHGPARTSTTVIADDLRADRR
jgi:plasmid stability protein